MQIREDVYNWLVSLKIITNDGKKYIDKVEVSKPVVVNFENGNLFSKLLKELHKLYTRSNNRFKYINILDLKRLYLNYNL